MRRRRRPSAAGRRRRRSPPFPYPPRRLPRSNASWPRRLRDPPRANRRVRRALGRSRRRPTAPLASSRWCQLGFVFSETPRSVVNFHSARQRASFGFASARAAQRTTRRFLRTSGRPRRSPGRPTAPFAPRAFASRVSSAARRVRLRPRWQLRWQASILKNWQTKNILKRCRASPRCRG